MPTFGAWQFGVHKGQTGDCRMIPMPKMSPSYRVVEIPPARRDTHNYLDLYWWKHSIYALLEVDVTRVRQFIEEHEAQTGEALSFTGYLAFCLGRAVDEDKSVQAYPKGRKHLVIFDDVDIFMPVERELGGNHAAIPYVIRRANHKSYLDIHREIRAFQTEPIQPGKGMPAGFRVMMSTPWPLPRLFIRLIRARQPPQSHAPGSGGGDCWCDSAGHGRPRRWLGPGAGWAIRPLDCGRHHAQASRH